MEAYRKPGLEDSRLIREFLNCSVTMKEPATVRL